ncbi:MAG: hypothetical protein ACRDTA_25575, partial [Pseudonocardiaceae bacterium]
MTATARPYRDNVEHLRDELRCLDLLIRLRAAQLALQNQLVPEAQAARTVYITAKEVDWLLAADGDPARDGGAAEEARAALARLSAEIEARIERSAADGVPLALPALGRLFGLSPVELQAVVVCLAPELRRKYDRLYAYLQDDITRKRPSVDLVLELVCETEEQRWRARASFFETASLLRAGLLQRVDDPHSPSGSSGLAQFLVLDPRICQFLLGGGDPGTDHLDDRLAGRARVDPPAGRDGEPGTDPAITASVLRLVEHHVTRAGPDPRALVLYLHGPAGVGRRDMALRACQHLDVPLLTVDAAALLAQGTEAEGLLRLAFREGLLRGATIHLEHADALTRDTAHPLLRFLAATVTDHGGLVVLSGEEPWAAGDVFAGLPFQPVALPVPDVPLRTAVWRRTLAGRTPDAAAWAGQLGARFRLTPGRIRAAVEAADN